MSGCVVHRLFKDVGSRKPCLKRVTRVVSKLASCVNEWLTLGRPKPLYRRAVGCGGSCLHMRWSREVDDKEDFCVLWFGEKVLG